MSVELKIENYSLVLIRQTHRVLSVYLVALLVRRNYTLDAVGQAWGEEVSKAWVMPGLAGLQIVYSCILRRGCPLHPCRCRRDFLRGKMGYVRFLCGCYSEWVGVLPTSELLRYL